MHLITLNLNYSRNAIDNREIDTVRFYTTYLEASNQKSFKKNYSIALMIDQRVSEGIRCEFFGQPALTTTIPAQLFKKFGCKIVPVYVERVNGIFFKIKVDLEALTAARNPARLVDFGWIVLEAQKSSTAQIGNPYQLWYIFFKSQKYFFGK